MENTKKGFIMKLVFFFLMGAVCAGLIIHFLKL
jgi:hypothetical protein